MQVRVKPFYDLSALPDIAKPYVAVFHGGSRVMCTPPPQYTDDDYILLYSSAIALKEAVDRCLASDWALGGSLAIHNKGHNIFYSLKKGDLNLVMTDNEDWYSKMLCATKICMELNEHDKQERIKIFEAIVYGLHPW